MRILYFGEGHEWRGGSADGTAQRVGHVKEREREVLHRCTTGNGNHLPKP